jgi:FkbM family methyltransferase
MLLEIILRLTAAYVRYFPLMKGKKRIIAMVFKMNFPNISIITKSNDGRYFEFNPRSMQAFQIFFWGTREKYETEIISSILRTGDKAIDIGANIGWYTTLMSKYVGLNGKVIAIEPVPSTFIGLKKSLELNHNLNNVIFLNLACSDHVGKEIIHEFPSMHPGLSSGRTYDGIPKIEHQVPADTIDRLIDIYGFTKVHLVKIDVEGSELAVLRGAVNSLSNSMIEALMIEANQERCLAFGYQFEECVKFIQECDYRYIFYRIQKREAAIRKMHDISDYKSGDNILVLLKESEIWKRIKHECNLFV